jgi:ParB-like chromosome segregation protein Spo0J
MEKEKVKSGNGKGAGVQFLAEKVERWPIAKLRANERNAKKHPQAQIDQIANSIKEWGWTMPLVIAENGVIQAGEGRWLAAKHLGMLEVPVIVARGWSAAKLRAYVLADNKLSENGSWDQELLALELGALQQDGSEYLALTGFSEAQLQRLLPTGDQAGDVGNLESQFHVVIECGNEAQQLRLLKRFQQEGLTCRALVA